MSEEDEEEVRVCVLCGCRLPPSENICPQCGNVFHKDDSDWEWKLISRKRKNGSEDADDETK